MQHFYHGPIEVLSSLTWITEQLSSPAHGQQQAANIRVLLPTIFQTEVPHF